MHKATDGGERSGAITRGLSDWYGFILFTCVTDLCLAFLLEAHPQFWRVFLEREWRFLSCGNRPKELSDPFVLNTSNIHPFMNPESISLTLRPFQGHSTFPVGTLLLCSQGGWPGWRHHLRACLASWATSRDTEVCTWDHLVQSYRGGQLNIEGKKEKGVSHLCRKASKRRR